MAVVIGKPMVVSRHPLQYYTTVSPWYSTSTCLAQAQHSAHSLSSESKGKSLSKFLLYMMKKAV